MWTDTPASIAARNAQGGNTLQQGAAGPLMLTAGKGKQGSQFEGPQPNSYTKAFKKTPKLVSCSPKYMTSNSCLPHKTSCTVEILI